MKVHESLGFHALPDPNSQSLYTLFRLFQFRFDVKYDPKEVDSLYNHQREITEKPPKDNTRLEKAHKDSKPEAGITIVFNKT